MWVIGQTWLHGMAFIWLTSFPVSPTEERWQRHLCFWPLVDVTGKPGMAQRGGANPLGRRR
jgi:hypothetical protein